MFNSYTTKEFGKRLKDLRMQNRLTQADVKKLVGVTEDGLRRIENGYVMPKFETLIHLSEIYKSNLLELLIKCQKEPHLIALYKEVGKAIKDNNAIEIARILDKLEHDSISLTSNKLVSCKEYQQLVLFCKGSILFIDRNALNLHKAKNLLITSMKITIPFFSYDSYKSCLFNPFEIRILHLISLVELKMKSYQNAINLMTHLISSLDTGYNDIETMRTLLLLYFNISYAFHDMDDHENALKYADYGIKHALHYDRLPELHLLYYRKGIAEYHLNSGDYMDSLSTAICLLKIMGKFDMISMYKDVSLKFYGIHL